MIGDSKTLGQTCCEATNGYRDELVTDLLATGNWPTVGVTTVLAQSGGTAATINVVVAAGLPVQELQADVVLVAVGANDLVSGTSQVSFEASLGSILDAVHAKWSKALVYLSRPYRPAYAAQSATMAGWLANVASARAAWAFVGPDESTFLPGNMSDDAHPSLAGYSLWGAAWQTAMGY